MYAHGPAKTNVWRLRNLKTRISGFPTKARVLMDPVFERVRW
jgi:hypothetical protein